MLKRLRQWFIWFGGWESPTRGWHFNTGPTPISILGHAATFFSGWGQVRCGRGWIVWYYPFRRSLRQSSSGALLYWSPNATPWHDGARLLIGNRLRWERDRN